MSARSTNVTLKNATTSLLVLIGNALQHGEWTSAPPTYIMPGGEGVWQNDSNGFMTGDQGWVNYGTILHDNPVGTTAISWDNPYIGSNGYGVAAPNGYTISYTGGSGDNASIVVTLSIATGVAGKTTTFTVEK